MRHLQCSTNASAYVQEPVAGSRAGDLIKLCNEKHHATLNQTLQAAGTPALEGGGVTGEPPAQTRSQHTCPTQTMAVVMHPVLELEEQCPARGGCVMLTLPSVSAPQWRAERRCWRR